MRQRDRLSGILYGAVIGSALGSRTEYLPLDAIHARYGTTGKMLLATTPRLTDSGSLTLATVEALRSARFYNSPETVRVTVAELARWRDEWAEDDSSAAITRAIENLADGRKRKTTWTRSPSLVPSGSVLAKAALTAVLTDKEKALGVAQLQTALTNAAPISLVTAELVSVATRLLLNDEHPRELPALLESYARRCANTPDTYRRAWLGDIEHRWESTGAQELSSAWLRAATLMSSVLDALAKGDRIVNVCEVFGARGSAATVLPAALYFTARYHTYPKDAVSMACRTSGDSADIASLTGTLIGAHHGTSRFPRDWVEETNRRWGMEEYADVLYSIG